MNSLNARVATVVRSQAGVKGWSTNRLAEEAGEPTPNVRRYFWTGERPVPLEALGKIADAFGWTTSELLQRAEETEPEPFVEPRPRAAADPTAKGKGARAHTPKTAGRRSPVTR